MNDPVTALVVALFRGPGVALTMAGAILIFALILIGLSSFLEYQPLVKALVMRWNLLSANRGPNARRTFVADFNQYDLRFGSASQAPAPLVLGWANFRSLLVESEDGAFATSIRASEAFDRLDEPARSLEWWANILVAVGLVVTFLGIVAALTEATSAIASGGSNSTAIQSALIGLLAIAATKFWTSIAGVLSSIILRVVARFRRRKIEHLEANFFESLDACVEFTPPEKVAMEQLRTLNRLETALGGRVATASIAKG